MADDTRNTGMKLLVAIGDDRVRDSFAQALADYPGATRQVCGDSTEALRLAVESRPDVVLVGAELGPEDGFQTVQAIIAQVPGVSALLVAKNPVPADFRRALRAGARDMLEIPVEKKELFSAIEAASAVSRDKRTALEGLTAAALAEEREPARATGTVVFSTKGGTGKTFLATNLAAGLACAGKRVALVDLDLQFGDVAIALGLTPERTIYDLVSCYTEFDVTLMSDFMLKHSSGLHVLPAPLYPDQSEEITVADVRTVLEVVSTGYDHVIVDTPPFFEERVLAALDWADRVLLVGSLDIPSVKNIKVSFTTMDLMAYPAEKLRIVMNRADSKVGLDLSEVEKTLGRPVEQSVSSSIDVPRALNAGEVLLLSKPTSQVGRQLAALVEMYEPVQNNHRRQFGRFRRR